MLSSFYMNLLIEYLQLCWFKNNPRNLLPTKRFFINNLFFYLVLGITVEANISDPADATLEITAETIVTLVLVFLFLAVKKELPLFKQLLTALIVGENFIFTLGILTEILDVVLYKTPYEDYPAYIGGALGVWLVAIVAYIINQFFLYDKTTSVLLAIAYILLTFLCPFLFMEVI